MRKAIETCHIWREIVGWTRRIGDGTTPMAVRTGGTRIPAKARTELNKRITKSGFGTEDVVLMVHRRSDDDGTDGHGNHNGIYSRF